MPINPKLKRYIFKYTGIKINLKNPEWRNLTPEQKEQKINDLERDADRARSIIDPITTQERHKGKLASDKKALVKYTKKNPERRKEQVKRAQQKFREKKKFEKKLSEIRQKSASKKITSFFKKIKQQVKKYIIIFTRFEAKFFYKPKGSSVQTSKGYTQTNNKEFMVHVDERKITYEFVKNLILEHLGYLIDAYGQKIALAKLIKFRYHYKTYEFLNDDDVSNIPMRELGVKNIDGFDKQDWDKQQGTCVFDYLQWKYIGCKGMKKRFSTYDNINLMLNGVDPINQDSDDEDIEIEDLQKEGVSSYHIKNLCKICKFVMYACDDNDKTFLHYKPPKYDTAYPALVYRLSNNHIYPVDDIPKKKSIIKVYEVSTTSDILHYERKKKTSNEDTINLDKDIEIIEDVEPMKYLSNTIINSKIPSKINYCNGVLKSFNLDNKQYIFNHDVECIRKLCKNLNIDYEGQGIITMINYIIEITLGHKMPKSHANNLIYDNLEIAKKNRAHTGLFNENLKHLLDDKDTKAYDINKCYTSCLYNASEDWFKLDFNDAWNEVHEFNYDNIEWGLYKIETHDTLLFKGNDIYSHSILRKAKQHDIPFTITHMLVPSHKVKHDIFKQIIDNIIEITKDIYKNDKPYYKYAINILSGLLGKSSVTMTKANINSDINQILYQFGKIHNDVDETFINQIEDIGYYIYGGNKHVKIAECNVPMYIQVLDASNILMFDLINAVGGQLIGRKVDCVVVNTPNNIFNNEYIKYGNEWGEFQEADHIPVMLSMEKNNFDKHYIMSVKWKDHNINDSSEFMKIKDVIDKYKGLLITGGPGNGKTFVANKLAELFPKNVRIAPTNKAARLIKGKTIHRFLALNDEMQISPAHLKTIKNTIDYIIIDEISMVNKNLWQRLSVLKAALPHLIFILIGDKDQLSPVEPNEINALDNYFDHPAVLNLANSNMIILTKTYRFSPALKRLLDDINEYKVFDTSPYTASGYTNTRYNLCFFNSTRKAVNKYWNNKERPVNSVFIPEDIEDEYTQDMYVYENLPVIARRTINKGDICVNNETFTVSCIDDNYVHLYTIRDDEPHYIEMEISKFSNIFLLNYCCTIHKSQGETIQDPITIYDWNSPKLHMFDLCHIKRLKYTALSRIELKELSNGCYEELKDKLHISDLNIFVNHNNCLESNINKKIKHYRFSDSIKNFDTNHYIDTQYIINMLKTQNNSCSICGCDLLLSTYKSKDPRQFSIDRLNSNLGHVKGNVQITCLSCNCAKKRAM